MPHRMRHLNLLLATCLAAGPMFGASETLIDNDQVRVVRATDPPHVRGAAHRHQFNRVMIYLQAGRQEFVSEGKTSVAEWKAGEVKWSPAGPTHTSEIVSSEPVTMIEIEIKKPGDPARTADCPMHPLRVAPQQATLEFENPQVRVYRVKLGPREKLPMHEHVLNKISVNLTPQNERVITAAGQSEVVNHPSPTATWSGPVKHREESLTGRPMETIVVELKN